MVAAFCIDGGLRVRFGRVRRGITGVLLTASPATPDAASPPRSRRRWLWLALLAVAALVAAVAVWHATIAHAQITSYSVHPDGTISVTYVVGGGCPDTLWERAHVVDSGVVVDVAYRKPWPWEAVAAVAAECTTVVTPDAPFVDGNVMMPDGAVVTTVRPY